MHLFVDAAPLIKSFAESFFLINAFEERETTARFWLLQSITVFCFFAVKFSVVLVFDAQHFLNSEIPNLNLGETVLDTSITKICV